MFVRKKTEESCQDLQRPNVGERVVDIRQSVLLAKLKQAFSGIVLLRRDDRTQCSQDDEGSGRKTVTRRCINNAIPNNVAALAAHG